MIGYLPLLLLQIKEKKRQKTEARFTTRTRESVVGMGEKGQRATSHDSRVWTEMVHRSCDQREEEVQGMDLPSRATTKRNDLLDHRALAHVWVTHHTDSQISTTKV